MSDLKKIKELQDEYINRFEPPTATLSVTPVTPQEQDDLFPDTKDTIRPELNVSKFADFIFASPRHHSLDRVRSKRFGVGEKTGKIDVSPATFLLDDEQITRTFTVITEEYFYALIQIWEDQRCPTSGHFWTSGREIFRILGKNAGKAQYRILERELLIMQGAVIYFNKFKTNEKQQTRTRRLEPLSFLRTFVYYNRANLRTDEIFGSNIEIYFDEKLTRNLNNGITKPVSFKEKLSIKSYDSRRLYSMLDVHLSPRQRIKKRKATNLLSDLDIDGKRYEARRNRRIKLLEFKKDLDGKKVSRGKLSLKVEKGVDDWLLVSTLTPSKEPRRVPKHSANLPEIAQELFEDMQRFVGISTKPQGGHNDPIGLVYATTYPAHVVRSALSIFKSDAYNNPEVKSPIKVFTAILHREVHRAGLGWIGKTCGKELCKFNPRNELL